MTGGTTGGVGANFTGSGETLVTDGRTGRKTGKLGDVFSASGIVIVFSGMVIDGIFGAGRAIGIVAVACGAGTS